MLCAHVCVRWCVLCVLCAACAVRAVRDALSCVVPAPVLQVPRAYLERFAPTGRSDNRNHARQIYAAVSPPPTMLRAASSSALARCSPL